MATPFEDGWAPAVHSQVPYPDKRFAAWGPRGYKLKNKRKLEEMADAMDTDEPREAIALGRPAAAVKKVKRDVTGLSKGSSRVWKAPGTRVGAMKDAKLAVSWEKRMKDKAERKAFTETMAEMRRQRGERLKAIREQKEASIKRKEENRRKSAVVQKISNTQKLKKMMKSKKQRKTLMMADTN
ncbi:unnamed protein product [Ostreobium quekettii]|uniref:Coiled-coil domain-containing protein 86 n=1 Tax=Ostreobium quekettii TaxID=121088 RepID=A0A8S1J5R0_9CHLO|nr:unnamed protein product [Ostreobium quekettii]|eukprot:evm.model.scf_1271.3 EVM.evm.TU.scf_1271.3   scf_1271:17592-19818(+)